MTGHSISGSGLVLALALATAVSAQKPRVETFTLDNGLPSAEVYDLEQDATGRLWILGRAGLSVRDAAAGDAEALARDVAHISAAARQMRRLLDELLELSRVGRVVSPSEPVDLEELAREAVALVLGDGDRGVEVAIHDDLPVVFGDRVRLLEVLQNLVDNAVKYMGGQGAPRVEIGLRAQGGERVIYVRDNGMGVEPRYHERIFGLFERLDSASDGTGIGLALARRIVEFHGGRMWVESTGAGRGTTLCFTLSSIDPSAVEEET